MNSFTNFDKMCYVKQIRLMINLGNGDDFQGLLLKCKSQ